MVDVQVRYNDSSTFLDLDEKGLQSQMALTLQVADIQTLSQVNASYSKKFQVPATANNNLIFGYSYESNNPDFDTLKNDKSCEIYANGLEIMRGKARVERVGKNNTAKGYDLTVIGDNYDMFVALDDIQVSGLSLGTFQMSQANVEASWNYTSASGNVVFAPIDWGNKNYNSFDLADLTPSFFVRNILLSGFVNAGIGYESNFLDSDYAKRLTTPFNGIWTLSESDYTTVTGYSYFLAEESSLSITASGASTKQYIDISETTSNIHYNPNGSRYTAANPSKSKYTFSFEDIDFPGFPSSPLNNAVLFNLANVVVGIEINGNEVVEKTVDAYSFSAVTSNIQTLASDVVRPYIKTDFDFDLTNVVFKSSISHDIVQDMTVTLSDYVPIKQDGLSVFDLFKGLAETFNFQIEYDPFAKLLRFEPYGDYYSGELDWSDKWNQDQEASYVYLGDKLNQKILHRYAEDSTDYGLTRWDDGYEKREPYASYLMELPRNYIKGRREVTNSLFAPTIDFEYEQFGGTIPNIRWNTKDGTQWSGGRGGQIPTMRLLYYEGKNNSGNFKMNVGSGDSYSVQSYSYLPRLAFRAVSGESWQSLAMDSWDNKAGAFETYFEPKYRNVNNGITATYWLNLSVNDIAKRPLSKIIHLDGAKWYINKIIDFNPANTEPTQVELLKVIDNSFTINATTSPWVDIVTGKKFDPVSHKPNNDLPTNPGFDVTSVSGTEPIQPLDDDRYGTAQGVNNQAPNKSNSVLFGNDLTTYYSDQFIVGKFNDPNKNDLFQVGGGTSASGRQNAFSVRAEGGEFNAYLNGGRVVNDNWHMTTSGVKKSSYKTFTGSGTTAGDGSLTVYTTHDATSSGVALFNEITHISAIPVEASAGSRHVKVSSYSTTAIVFEVNPNATVDLLYKIEGN